MGVGARLSTDIFSNILSTASISQFVGCQQPEDPKLGDVYFDQENGCSFIYCDEVGWECISQVPKLDYNTEREHVVKKTRCSTCGAILPVRRVDDNGLCECQYCKNIEYVWE